MPSMDPPDDNVAVAEQPALPDHNGDHNGDASKPDPKHVAEKANESVVTNTEEQKSSEDEKKPPGGPDSTPLPHLSGPTYTLKITFHRAVNLPMADMNTLSSDPYLFASFITPSLPSRHKEDQPLSMRTPTVRRNAKSPVWDFEWVVAGVPKEGAQLRVRVMDEDPGNHDDKLGNVYVDIPPLTDEWEGIKEETFKVKKRGASKRAYLFRAFAVVTRVAKHMSGDVVISVEMVGRSEKPKEDKDGGRLWTVSPCWWTRHYSPLLGRMVGKKEPGEGRNEENDKQRKAEKYDFQANQIQLQGPVPAPLYCRYVEFKPFVKPMFTASGIRGYLLSKALHHQHSRIYNYSGTMLFGEFPAPCVEMTQKFLDLVHYDEGGRLFTYVLMLDGVWRFTETGKSFGIDFLSKHTMHSDVSIYIACSGEFFIRRLKHPPRQGEGDGRDGKGTIETQEENPTHPPDPSIPDGPPNNEPSKDPAYYELIIDNDSGTYRPTADLLPYLREFLEKNLVGLKVVTLDCNADEELMDKMKQEQREGKQREGDGALMAELDKKNSEEDNLFKHLKRDAELVGKEKKEKVRGIYKGRGDGDVGAQKVNGHAGANGDAKAHA